MALPNLPPSVKKIVLCGFMGAGKTTALVALKNHLKSWKIKDLDEEIYLEQRNGAESYLGQIIDRIGWERFRAIESIKLEQILNDSESHILALGGGALAGKNLEMIKKLGSVCLLVWIATPLGECLKRIGQQESLTPGLRPLAKKDPEELASLFDKRLPYYQKADLTWDQFEKLYLYKV